MYKSICSFLIFCFLGSQLLVAQSSIAPTISNSNSILEVDSTAISLASSITPKSLSAHLNFLASDECEGRETGTPGQKKAAAYISDQFQALGLPKVGADNSYYQPVIFTKQKWEKVALNINGKEYRHLWDFYSFQGYNSEVNSLKRNEVIFLGYGIESPNYNDYKKVNVKDKIVVIYRGEPYGPDSLSYVTGTKEPSEFSGRATLKLETAKKYGAAAVLIIDHEFSTNLNQFRRFIVNPRLSLGDNTKKASKYANQISISSEVAKSLFGKKIKKVIKARNKILKKGKPKSVKVKCDIEIVLTKNVEQLISENVMGYIEGTDPVMKDELIVLSAHYDHLGVRGDGIYNGADDNASGTSTIIEVAKAFAEAKKNGDGPKRSVLALLVTGEEKGLLGSQYYTEFPIFPLEKTVANVNVDMVGRIDDKHLDNPDYVYVIGADKLSSELHNINEAANKTYTNLELDYTYNDENDPNRYYYRSDHYNFAEKGIPAVFFFNGTHKDYHRITDTAEKIQFDKMATIGKLVFHTAWELANRDKRIEVDAKKK